MNRTERRRKLHMFSCCVQKRAQPKSECAVCGCSPWAGRHRQSDNRHYHEFVPRIPVAERIPRAPIFAEIA